MGTLNIKTVNTDRFWAHVEKTGSCWLWHGSINGRGYGTYSRWMAHRLAYSLQVAPIPEGMTIDHAVCSNKLCVNPSHFEIVTGRVNTLRGNAPSAQNARRTHCVRGHEFTKRNTKIDLRGKRVCRACVRSRRARDKEVVSRRNQA